jgi:phage baseplate assembly protein W
MDNNSQEFLGVGWKFPIEFKTGINGPAMLSGEAVIKNSLDVLFATRAGERVMQPEYGSQLDHFVFENLSKSIMTYMTALVSDAILFHEPRIVVNDIDIEPQQEDPAYINIKVDYTISSTNNRYNYVYPYYIKEGTNLLR